MKTIFTLLIFLFVNQFVGFSQSQDTLIDPVELIDTTVIIKDTVSLDNIVNQIDTFDINAIDTSDFNTVIVQKTDSVLTDSILIDSVLIEEAKVFNEDTKIITDSIVTTKTIKPIEKEFVIDSTLPYGFHFVKKFTMEQNNEYHYVIFDAQHHEPLFHVPHSKKKREIKYEDDLLKLEIDGPMKLYSIILAEKVIGSLENFKKVYYTEYEGKILRVNIHGAGHHFFKEFEKMYYGNVKGRLNGERFRTVNQIVDFFNKNLPE